MAMSGFSEPGNKLRLGCIADDFTGATDLASNLTEAGMRVVQTMGIPADETVVNADAVVIALKSRTLPPQEAVEQSLRALAWLKAHGAEQIYFKYCSTFDSVYTGSQRGNIGPVIDALMEACGASLTIATPAFPANGRTVFKGHLFVGDVLLSESGMRDHPLTPMRDANLQRVLQAQCSRKVGLLDYGVVRQGPDAIRTNLQTLQAQGIEVVVVDALDNQDLMNLGCAVRDLPLVTAGSGLAIGIPQNHGLRAAQNARLPAPSGAQAVVSGSCSVATNAQVAHFVEQGLPAYQIDPSRLFAGEPVVEQALQWAATVVGSQPLLIYSTAGPEQVQTAQSASGALHLGSMLESALAQIARGLVRLGVRQLLVAGGETSGACVQALQIHTLQVGPAVAPGVPWCHVPAEGDLPALHLLLKSGNFGAVDIFSAGFGVLQ